MKPETMEEVARLLKARYASSHEDMIAYLLNMFSTFDLLQIKEDLKRPRK